MNKDKKRAIKWIPIGLIMLLIIMLITTPNHKKFDKWVMQKYGINCEFDRNLGSLCYKDGEKINSKSSHFLNAGIYASYEINYKYESGEKETFRTLGVLGTLIQMKEGYLWEVLN